MAADRGEQPGGLAVGVEPHHAEAALGGEHDLAQGRVVEPGEQGAQRGQRVVGQHGLDHLLRLAAGHGRRSTRSEPQTDTGSKPSATARCTTCQGGCPPSAGSGKTSCTASSPPGTRCGAKAA